MHKLFGWSDVFLFVMAFDDGFYCALLHIGLTNEGVQSITQQMMQNPQLMTNIMQAPYMQSMLQNLASNPETINQVRTKLWDVGFRNCLGLSSLKARDVNQKPELRFSVLKFFCIFVKEITSKLSNVR